MLRKALSLLVVLCLIFQQGFAQVMPTGPNPALDSPFRPTHIRYFSYDSLRDRLEFMLDKGNANLGRAELETASRQLLDYFLIGLTLPNDSFWVNLRPDSEDQIIDAKLSRTDVGKIMLETDLQLKKDTARFTSPETPEGKEYWTRLYKKAEELYGSEDITIPTFTRPWIVPNEIIVRETKESAYIFKATLKVMLEQDYVKDSNFYKFTDSRARALNDYSTQLIRELILPKLTREVNLSQRYAPLRQVFYSIVLSRWFKTRFAGTSTKYASLIDKGNLTDLASKESWSKSDYFNAYRKSFTDGEYNIKKAVKTPTGQVIRTYVSGGLDLTPTAVKASGMMANGGSSSDIFATALPKAGLVSGSGSSPAMPSQVSASSLAGEAAVDADLTDLPARQYTVTHPASSPLTIGRDHSLYGPHPSQANPKLTEMYERVAWARTHAPEELAIQDIIPILDQKHGTEPREAITFKIILTNNFTINMDAPVPGGISSGKAEPGTHPSIKEAINFFNANVRPRMKGLNVARPGDITARIIEIDNEFKARAEDKEKHQFSYIGAELAIGVSMITTIALAATLGVPVEVVMNYDYNELAISQGLATEVRPMSIPVNFSVVWEGGKHGVAKSLADLIQEGIIKDGSRFPKRFHDPEQSKDKDNQLAMVPPQETQIMVFAPTWAEAQHTGIKLTKAFQTLLKQRGIKKVYGAESGATTEQMRDKAGRVITLDYILEILDGAVNSLPANEARYVRYALDIAASEMYIPEIGMYYIGPEAAENDDGLVTNEQFTVYKLALFKKFTRFISCEDWAVEDKIEHWEDAKQIMVDMIQMSDDNVVSRADLIRRFTKAGVTNAHLQKPNQSSERAAMWLAVATSHSLGNVIIWSHRGTRPSQEMFTAQGAIATGSFGGKWTLWGPGRGALIAAMNEAVATFESLGVSIPYQGALVLDPDGPYKDVGWAQRVRREIAAAGGASSPLANPSKPVGGIDFKDKALQINYELLGDFSKLKPNLPVLSQAELSRFNIEGELFKLEEMVQNQTLPSGQNIKKVIAACIQSGEFDDIVRERIIALLVKVGILEETQCWMKDTSKELKEALVLADLS